MPQGASGPERPAKILPPFKKVAKCGTNFPRGGKNKCRVASICHSVARNFPRCGKNKSRVALICHLCGIECHSVARNFPRCGKNKSRVALICRVVAGKNCHLGKMWHANLKGGNYIVYPI